MIKIKYFILLFIFSILSSCLTVTRPNSYFSEKKVSNLPLKLEKDVFKNFLWTKPPVYGIELKLENKGNNFFSMIKFCDTDYKIIFNKDDTIIIKNARNEEKGTYSLFSSEGDIYYNLDKLKIKRVPKAG